MKHLRSLGLLTFAIVGGTAAMAQTSTTGALAGTILNERGTALSGASIRLVSGQVTRTAMTDAAGNWRLALLNPGPYQMTIAKAGFSTTNQRVDVSLNETKTINLKMSLESSATVEVISASVGVDLTSSQTGSNFSTETLKSVPMGRDMNSLADFTPGVVAGAEMGGWGKYFGKSISGATGSENQYVVDGLSTTDARYGGNGARLVTDFIDQVEVQTGAFKPEYSALGGVFNVITKSGSNTFKGSSWITWDPTGIAAKPKHTPTVSQENPLTRYDVGFEVGGAFIKDKLFYFVGVDAAVSNAPSAGTNNIGLTSSERNIRNYQFTGKINYYVTPDFQLTLASNYSPYEDKTTNRYFDDGDRNEGANSRTFSRNTSLTTDWVVNADMILSLKLGTAKVGETNLPTDMNTRIYDQLAFLDAPDWRTPWGAGRFASQHRPNAQWKTGGYGFFNDENNTNDQIKLDFSWFLGAHQLKAGISHQKSEYRQNSYRGHAPSFNADGSLDTSAAGMGGEITLYTTSRYGNANPTSSGYGWGGAIARYSQESYANGVSNANYDAIYIQDTWEALPGLRVSYGVRAENQELIDSDHITYLKFGFKDQLQPRLGVIWDPSNDGKSKITANFAQYNEVFPLRYGMRYRGGRFQQINVFRNITDYNVATGAFTVDPGLAQNDPDRPWLLNPDDQAIGYNNPPVVDGTKAPQRTEWVLGYDRNLAEGWSVGMHATFRKLIHPVEDMTPSDVARNSKGYLTTLSYVDQGIGGVGQAVLGNPRGGTFSWMTNPKSDSNTVPGVSQRITWQSNLPEASNKYNALDVIISRRRENSFYSLSYTWSRAYGNYQGVAKAGQRDTNGSSDYDLPANYAYGPLPTDHTHVIKLIGSNTFAVGIGKLTIGYVLNMQSGTPFSKVVPLNSDLGWTLPKADRYLYDSYDWTADQRYGNTGMREPFYRNLDLRLDYEIAYRGITIIPSFDIKNAFNTRVASRYIDTYTANSGTALNPTFGAPDLYRDARNYRAGVKVRF